MKLKKLFQIAALLLVPLALLLYLRSVQSWRPFTLVKYQSAADSAAFSPDGKLLATCGDEGDVSIWDARTKVLVRKLSSSPAHASQIAWSPDGRSIAASLDCFFNDEEGEVRLWAAETGKLKTKLKTFCGRSGVAFSSDGRFMTASGSGSVPLWDLRTGKLKLLLKEDGLGLESVTLGRDAQVVIGSTQEWSVVKLYTSKAAQNNLYYGDFLLAALCAVFAPNGKTLAAGTTGRVIFYDVQTWKVSQQLNFPQATVTAVAFSPDGKFFAAGSDNAAEIKIWNLQSGQLTRTLRGHSKTITALSFAPDDATLASSSEDGTVRLWRLR